MSGRRARVTVLVLALVVLAGCNAGLGGGQSTPRETVTPVALSTEDGTTATPARRVPGLATNGSFDQGDLLLAHVEALEGRSFERVVRTREWTHDPTRHLTRWSRITAAVENRSQIRIDHVGRQNGQWVNYSRYTGPDRSYFWWNGEASIATDPQSAGALSLANVGAEFRYVPDALASSEVTVAVVRRNGRLYYRLHTIQVPRYFESRGARVANYSVTLFVRPDGFVRTLHAEWDEHEDGIRRHFRHRVTYRGVGETRVDTPRWVRQFLANQTGGTPTAGPGTPATGDSD